jgi:hypothetical protein
MAAFTFSELHLVLAGGSEVVERDEGVERSGDVVVLVAVAPAMLLRRALKSLRVAAIPIQARGGDLA